MVQVQGTARYGGGNMQPGTMPRGQQFRVLSQNRQAVGKGYDAFFQFKAFIHVPAGNQAAEIAVAVFVFNQADGALAARRIGNLGTYDGHEPFLFACV